MSPAGDLEQHRAELNAVIASGIFAKAPSLALLLEYVCTRYFEGNAAQIKEYNIAVEALGRPTTFDPRQDSIVRVEAFRLRKRLKQYYAEEGAERPLRIVIPPGQYVPQFLENAAAPVNGGPPDHDLANIEAAGLTSLAAPQAERAEASVALISAPVEAPRRPSRWFGRAALAGVPPIALVLIAVIWALRTHSTLKPPSAPRATSAPIGTESDEVLILCGSNAARYVDHLGNVWSGDRFFHGGSAFEAPNHTIRGTNDPEIFRARREGNFSYDIPLKPGVYELHLYFAETLFGDNNTAGGGESSRVFNVSINGKPVLVSFDVLSDAAGSNTADERVFKDVSPAADGLLHLKFSESFKEQPFLNALEILAGIPGKTRPVRIVTATRSLTDRRGTVWGPDRYFSRGFTVTRFEPVANTPDPELFQNERYGNFTYTIPVAEGHYAVTLRFAETWFGPGKPPGGGIGSRAFDIYCNGVALLRNFDVYRAAGGGQRAIEKTFHNIVPNAQGKIVLSFVPVVNYANVNAIEIVDESS